MIGLLASTAACAIIACVVSLGAGHSPHTPISQQISRETLDALARDTGSAISLAGSAVSTVATSAPIVGQHVDGQTFDAWVRAVSSIPERYIDAGPRQLAAADMRLEQCNLGHGAASAMIASVDTSLGVILATVADPERAITLAFEP